MADGPNQPTNGIYWRLKRLEDDVARLDATVAQPGGVIGERLGNLSDRVGDQRVEAREALRALHEDVDAKFEAHADEVAGLRRAIVISAVGVAATAVSSMTGLYWIFGG